jgi:predicted RNA-binding Zn-ribbon protein involved in translation (DUF1610 family)
LLEFERPRGEVGDSLRQVHHSIRWIGVAKSVMPPLVNDPVFKFCCKTCGQKISVPEGLQGQKFSCPNCAAQGHVPGAEPREFTEDPGSVIKFYCTSCQQKLSVPEGLRGQKYSCPNCAARGHVPGAEPRELTTEWADTIKFLCRNCEQKLSCAKDSVGQALECPICHKETIARIGTPDSPSTLPPAFSQNPAQKVVLPEKNGVGGNGAIRNGAGKNGSEINGHKETNGVRKEIPQVADHRPPRKPKPSASPNGENNGRKETNGVRKAIPPPEDHRPQREPVPSVAPTGENNGRKVAKRGPGEKLAGKPSWWRMMLGGGGGSLWEEDAEPSVVPIKRSAGNGAARNGNGAPKAEAARNTNGTPKPEAARNTNGAPKPEAARNGNGAPKPEPLEILPEIELPTEPNGSGPDPAPEIKSPSPEKMWEPTTTVDELFESLIELGFEVDHISVAQEDSAAGDRQ